MIVVRNLSFRFVNMRVFPPIEVITIHKIQNDKKLQFSVFFIVTFIESYHFYCFKSHLSYHSYQAWIKKSNVHSKWYGPFIDLPGSLVEIVLILIVDNVRWCGFKHSSICYLQPFQIGSYQPNLCESSWVIPNGPFYDYLPWLDYLDSINRPSFQYS